MSQHALSIPVAFEEITPEWLTHALRATGVFVSGSVTSVEPQRIAVGGGFTTQVARCRVAYDSAAASAPPSLIVKLPPADPVTRAFINRRGVYEREVRFYEELAQAVPVATPRRFYSATDPLAGNYILMLEDLAPARVGDILGGGTAEDHLVVIEEMAKLHAGWWNSPRLEAFPWLPSYDADADLTQDVYEQRYPVFLERFGDRTPEPLQDMILALRGKVARIRHRLAMEPRTIAHGDCRLDNMMFGSGDDQPRFMLLDWQLTTKGPGVLDIANFLAGVGVTGVPLLQRYHTLLREHGVRDYSWEQCVQGFRLALCDRLSRLVNALTTYDGSSERAQALATALIARTNDGLVSNNVLELLRGTE